ncbi:MurR/RpiR family transcriptional regulator [Companilactobacillus huachuanensis]|uniref:MurR/RpiR family transcriptional regulator n=1 Tax=Companilactobacillus huachuanensis TaxID=2559914 RepID=A0ABW1RQI9_9LACO|nr:MurR/RpiR family transcriptional regulator [Companilactobacillus huachuanensis]
MDNILYNLLYSLNDQLDKNEIGSVNFILSRYFIENFNKIPKANIYQMAEDCSVSRASIRRFSQGLGFENFADIKKTIKNHLPEEINISDKNYRELLTGNLIRIVSELDERMNTHEIDVICNRIKKSKKMIILTSRTSMSNAKDFQIELASKGKLSYIISEGYLDSTIFDDIEKDDYIITLSVSGLFAKSVAEKMNQIDCVKDLITVNRIIEFGDTFNHVYYMSHLDHSTNADIYRAYGLHYFLDIIQNHY